MPEPRALRLTDLEWADDVPGIRDKAGTVDGARWALVEYAPGASREEWCEDGHRGLVLEGEIEYEFSDGREPLRAARGHAFLLPGGVAHRGRNLAGGPTTMFLIDDPGGVVTAPPSAIAAERPAEDGKPKVTFRHAGDRFLLVEYGDMEFDLQLNFRVLTANTVLHERGLDGLVDTGPGLRSNLIRYDPSLLDPDRLIGELNAVEDEVPAGAGLEIPSRVIQLPIAFDDSKSLEAVERYMRSVRQDAPNVEGANNIDYIVSYNGLADREALYEEVLATEWWNAFTGFFPGLPFMYPLDSRYAVFAPKYNPTRTWTAEGAVGLGGPCVAIYPVESPGGYQLFGRTLPIYDLAGRNAAFRPDPILIKPGDRVKFHRVSEEELDATWEEVRADRYEYRVDEDPFDVESWIRHCDEVAEEADEHRRRREVASEGTPVP